MNDSTLVTVHSPLIRAFMRLGLFQCLCSGLSPIVLLPLMLMGKVPFNLAGLVVAPLAMWLAFPFFRWHSQAVYACADGIQLGRRLIPWARVEGFEYMGWWGGLLARLYRLSFNDGTPMVLFYGREEAEPFVLERIRRARVTEVRSHQSYRATNSPRSQVGSSSPTST